MSTKSTRQRRRPLPSRSDDGSKKKTQGIELNFDLTDTVDQFVSAIENGEADEIACYGTRGDGKTQGAFIGQVLHAVRHKAEGFALPTIWMGVTDTFESHKQKTVPSLQELHWEGRWRLYDGNHLAVYRVERQELVHLNLFGIEDRGATDRVRRAAHGMWFEEAAPTALMVKSTGISELAWSTGITSLRLPSYHNPAILTENYPDEDHWSWRHWHPSEEELELGGILEPEASGVKGIHPFFSRRMWIRVPPGERAPAEQRKKWMEALKDRPDLLGRLLLGKPGVVLLGPQVAEGFNESRHVSNKRLSVIKGEPLFIGLDFGHTPAAIIGQHWRGFIRVNAALPCERGGIRQHLELTVKPWLVKNCPWIFNQRGLIQGGHDPAGDTGEETDIDQSPMKVVKAELGGVWQEGAVTWEGRKGPMLASFNRAIAGEPALQIDPVDGRPLIKALNGTWYYPQAKDGRVSRDLPAKPNHPHEDIGDGYCYFLGRIAPASPKPTSKPKIEVKTQYNVLA